MIIDVTEDTTSNNPFEIDYIKSREQSEKNIKPLTSRGLHESLFSNQIQSTLKLYPFFIYFSTDMISLY